MKPFIFLIIAITLASCNTNPPEEAIQTALAMTLSVELPAEKPFPTDTPTLQPTDTPIPTLTKSIAPSLTPTRSPTPEPTAEVINADSIAGTWSGYGSGKNDAGTEFPERFVEVVINSGCKPGEICGYTRQLDRCKYDIFLALINEDKYEFLAKTTGGFKSYCVEGESGSLVITLRKDGTIKFIHDMSGSIIEGILTKQQ